MKLKIAILTLAALTLCLYAAVPTSNEPISAMPTASSANGGAFLPIIQPRPGQTTNDNFKVSVNTLFTGRDIAIITNLFVTNIYATTEYVTNLYVTNLYASNIVSPDLIWTNAGPWIAPIPFTNTFLITTNGSIESGKGAETWWGGLGSGDALISVSDLSLGESGYTRIHIAGVDDSASPTNYTTLGLMTVGGASPLGQLSLNSTLNGVLSTFEVNLQPSLGTANIQLYQNGVLNFAVNNSSGYSSTGTNFLADDGTYHPGTGTTINPTDQYIPYRFDGATFLDSPLYRIDPLTIGVDTIDANVIAATNLQSGGVVYTRLDGILTNVANGTGFLYNDGSNTNLVWAAASGGAGTWTNNGTTHQPINLATPLFWTNRVIWGPGTTNSLAREGRNLVWTNSDVASQSFGFVARDGSGAEAQFTVVGNTARVAPGTSGTAVDLYDNTQSVRWGGVAWSPIGRVANLGDIGGGYYPWSNIVSRGTTRIYGFEDITTGGTNYSRLAVSHGGTNSGPIFDSQSSGTAGPPRPMDFKIGGTNGFRIANNVGVWPNDAAKYFDGSGHWSTPAGGGGSANPSVSIGLAAVNGAAGTYMTSDSAPALSQSISPTWTEQHIWDRSSGSFAQFVFNSSDASSGDPLHNSPGVTYEGSSWYGGQVTYADMNLRLSVRPYGTADTGGMLWFDGVETSPSQAGHGLGVSTRGDVIVGEAKTATNTVGFLVIGGSSGVPVAVPESVSGLSGDYVPVTIDSSTGDIWGYVSSSWTKLSSSVPSVTKVQKTALTPVEGMTVFQTDNTPGLRIYQSGAWRMVSTVADP